VRVYIAGPYTADTDDSVLENVKRAMAAGLDLLMLEHAPVIPHLSHYFDAWARSKGVEVGYETYLAWDFRLLDGCEALLLLGSSPGADREVAYARDLGIPVYHAIEDFL
jgi:hypothetical protein